MAKRVLLGKKENLGYGLFVSEPGDEVDEIDADSLAFNSSDDLRVLKVIQTGTFQIQCKKTFMGKKGNLELLSDEQNRANAEYTRLYPFELDTQTADEYNSTAPKNKNVSLYGFEDGQVAFTGNGYNHEYIQNVYCDYGTQTIEFNPPLPSHIKTPFISVFFAVANSAGHFHPWYANVTCTTGEEDYKWQYANSQHCVHMDSAWFRGKWTFRERTVAPFGTDVNRSFGSDRHTLSNDGSTDLPSTYSGKYLPDGTEDYQQSVFSISDRTINDNQLGIHAPRFANPTTARPRYQPSDFTSFPGGAEAGKTWNQPVDYEVSRLEQDYFANNVLIHKDPISFNQGTASPTTYSQSQDTVVDLNSPSSIFGGAFKTFAGMQGISYFANNTHLKIDAFMTPTHTPTPFETELVKTREKNPDAAHGDINNLNWLDGKYDAGEFDKYGNIRKNVGLEHDGFSSTASGSSTPATNKTRPLRDAGGYPEFSHDLSAKKYTFNPLPYSWSNVVHRAWQSNYGLPYKEKLPRQFRTKYWDAASANTEYEWWPINHANGHFTIAFAAKGTTNSVSEMMTQTSIDSGVRLELKNMFESEAESMGFNSADTRIMHDHKLYLAATYGDYRPITYLGWDIESPYNFTTNFNTHTGNMNDDVALRSPFHPILNKGTRFSNQLPNTEGKGYPPNSQYEPADAFLKTRTFQGQPTSLDSFWNSFSNNTSQWVAANTPYGEFYYADGGYAMDYSSYYNYAGGKFVYAAEKVEERTGSGSGTTKMIKLVPTDYNIQRQSLQKHNWHGGNPKAGVGTEGRRFGFGGAGSAEALGSEGEGVFDTYIGKYVIYDLEGGDTSV